MDNSTTLSSIFVASTTTNLANAIAAQNEAHTTFLGGKRFSSIDYVIFALMFVVAIGISVYYAFFGKNQSSAKEYLMGGKRLLILPVAVSLVASHTSGLSLMAVPADVYVFGASFWLVGIAYFFLAIIVTTVYLPVFYDLQITSTYEYLEQRFDNRCRKLASGTAMLGLVLFMPIVVYMPSLALSAVSGISVVIITPIVSAICIFYTTIGGVKALVTNDSIQFPITMTVMGVVIGMGIYGLGGLRTTWNKNIEGGRLDIFDMNFDMTKRDVFWAFFLGQTVHWASMGSVHQSYVQKYLSVPTLADARKVVCVFALGMFIAKSICVGTGLIIYATYAGCDPLTTKKIDSYDQLLSYYILDIGSGVPGLAGIFIAGVFSSALSTLAGNLNSLSASVYQDFLKSTIEAKGWHHTETFFLKLIIVVAGIVSILLVFLVRQLGGLLSLAIAFTSLTNGPLFGMFTLGMLFPKANSKGAFCGVIGSLCMMTAILSGQQYYSASGIFKFAPKPISVAECAIGEVNMTLIRTINSTLTNNVPQELPFILFRISHYWYSMMGFIFVIIIGVVISCVTKKDEKRLNPKLLSPVIRYFVPKVENEKELEATNSFNYYSVETANKILVSETAEKN